MIAKATILKMFEKRREDGAGEDEGEKENMWGGKEENNQLL